MSSRASYFFGSSCLGHAMLPDEVYPGAPAQYHSHAFFCQRCGEIWGRVFVEQGTPHFDIHIRPCFQHSPILSVPSWKENFYAGLFQHYFHRREESSTMNWPLLPEFFPPSVLRRELALMFEHYDRRNHAQSQSSQAA